MSTKFFTNSEENTLINKFEGVFTFNPNIQYFDALVGYFRASGYFRIRPFLDKVPHIRILVGINIDKMLADAQKEGLEFFKNHEKTKEDFIKKIQEDIEALVYSSEIDKEQASALKAGDELKVKIIKVDVEQMKIGVSTRLD